MQPYQPDRVVRILTSLVSVAYFLMWVLAFVVVIVFPIGQFAGGGVAGLSMDASWETKIPVTISDLEDAFATTWDPSGRLLEVDELRGMLVFPMALPPTEVKVAIWAGGAVAVGLILLFLHHLRRLCQRVRAGAPFDVTNAVRMRTLGILLLVYHLFATFYGYWLSKLVRRSLDQRGALGIGSWWEIESDVVFIALVLIALAEIFRRGAALEDEQALVV